MWLVKECKAWYGSISVVMFLSLYSGTEYKVVLIVQRIRIMEKNINLGNVHIKFLFRIQYCLCIFSFLIYQFLCFISATQQIRENIFQFLVISLIWNIEDIRWNSGRIISGLVYKFINFWKMLYWGTNLLNV